MSRFKLAIIALLMGNILLLGLEASKPPAPEPTATAALHPRDGLPEIMLLGELDTSHGGDYGRQCFTVGPFETLTTVEAIRGMLQEYSTHVGERETEASVDRGFWVYLPPYPDARSARDAVEILYDANFDDVAVIRNGEWNFAVSLGYFISQSNAIRQRDRIRELGLPAEFIIKRHDETRYWVDYEQQAGVEYASRVLESFVPPELHRMIACSVPEGLAAN